MIIKATSARIVKLKPGDPDFSFSADGLVWTQRAAFEITSGCPYKYRDVIHECFSQGWLKPVAYMRDVEYTMELLKK